MFKLAILSMCFFSTASKAEIPSILDETDRANRQPAVINPLLTGTSDVIILEDDEFEKSSDQGSEMAKDRDKELEEEKRTPAAQPDVPSNNWGYSG